MYDNRYDVLTELGRRDLMPIIKEMALSTHIDLCSCKEMLQHPINNRFISRATPHEHSFALEVPRCIYHRPRTSQGYCSVGELA